MHRRGSLRTTSLMESSYIWILATCSQNDHSHVTKANFAADKVQRSERPGEDPGMRLMEKTGNMGSGERPSRSHCSKRQ